MKVLVTGANGQLGKSFRKIEKEDPSISFRFLARADLDITKQEEVMALCEEYCPDVVINCAAYTAVDKAENDSENAYQINEQASKYLAEAALATGSLLVHYSSDYVYHNECTAPIKESDITTPKGVYAKSKLAGEQKIIASGCKYIIIRTSWVYSEYGNNFVKTMIRLGSERDKLTIINDQIGCPTYATDIARDTLRLIDQYPFSPDHGYLLNYAGEGEISWYDFAKEIFRLKNIEVTVTAIPTTDYPTPAERPKWSVLDMGAVESDFGINPRDWREALAECIVQLP